MAIKSPPWELGEFINRDQGCVTRIDNSVSMYRFHVNDPIFFKNDIKVTLQAMGGGSCNTLKRCIANGAPYAFVTCDDGCLRHLYKQDVGVEEIVGYVNFFRKDHYRTVAYYYAKSHD